MNNRAGNVLADASFDGHDSKADDSGLPGDKGDNAMEVAFASGAIPPIVDEIRVYGPSSDLPGLTAKRIRNRNRRLIIGRDLLKAGKPNKGLSKALRVVIPLSNCEAGYDNDSGDEDYVVRLTKRARKITQKVPPQSGQGKVSSTLSKAKRVVIPVSESEAAYDNDPGDEECVVRPTKRAREITQKIAPQSGPGKISSTCKYNPTAASILQAPMPISRAEESDEEDFSRHTSSSLRVTPEPVLVPSEQDSAPSRYLYHRHAYPHGDDHVSSFMPSTRVPWLRNVNLREVRIILGVEIGYYIQRTTNASVIRMLSPRDHRALRGPQSPMLPRRKHMRAVPLVVCLCRHHFQSRPRQRTNCCVPWQRMRPSLIRTVLPRDR
jgi:hypothetical protein